MMKKFLALALALMMIFFTATVSAETDLTGMSDAELQELIAAARAELNSRSQNVGGDTVIYNRNKIDWYISGSEASGRSSRFTIDTVI